MWLLLRLGLAAGSLSAATIQFQVNNLGGNSFQYNYLVSGITFQANQELDIRFDPAFYGTLSNPVSGSGFQALVLQPNNPPGTSGDYSAYAVINNPPLTGPFRVDFTLIGAGRAGPQPFFINQYDTNGNFISIKESGVTTPVGTAAVPEPTGFVLCGFSLLLIGALKAGHRSKTKLALKN